MRDGRAMTGFTLLEVLIAILILGFGLLGLAMMQTMSVRFTESSDQRTKATNLAYDLLDQMRSNRLLVAQYTAASFTSTTATTCDIGTGAIDISYAISVWQCKVKAALGDEASAIVTYNAGVARVELDWNDQRWEKNASRAAGTYRMGTVTLSTRL